jgi:hypothetical protein
MTFFQLRLYSLHQFESTELETKIFNKARIYILNCHLGLGLTIKFSEKEEGCTLNQEVPKLFLTTEYRGIVVRIPD